MSTDGCRAARSRTRWRCRSPRPTTPLSCARRRRRRPDQDRFGFLNGAADGLHGPATVNVAITSSCVGQGRAAIDLAMASASASVPRRQPRRPKRPAEACEDRIGVRRRRPSGRSRCAGCRWARSGSGSGTAWSFRYATLDAPPRSVTSSCTRVDGELGDCA
jgi:hypothetical protein